MVNKDQWTAMMDLRANFKTRADEMKEQWNDLFNLGDEFQVKVVVMNEGWQPLESINESQEFIQPGEGSSPSGV